MSAAEEVWVNIRQLLVLLHVPHAEKVLLVQDVHIGGAALLVVCLLAAEALYHRACTATH